MCFRLVSLPVLIVLSALTAAAAPASAQGPEQEASPSPPACHDRATLGAADAWLGELEADMTVCLEVDLEAGELARAKAEVGTPSPMAGFTMETWGPDSKGSRDLLALLRPTVGAGSPPVAIGWTARGGGAHTLVLRNYWSWQHPEEPAPARVWIEMIEPRELVRARRRALESDDRVAWLRDHAVAVRTVSPEDDDFSDLMPLRDVLGGVRVVLLGESTHGSGTDLLAKTRLVKFLHEELGYDLLALESGLYEMSVAWESLRAGSSGVAALELGTWGLWTRSRQMQPLIRYLEQQAGGIAPLEITGFDNQFLLHRASAGFVEDLERVLSSRRISSRLLDEGSPVRNALAAMTGMRFRQGEEAPPARSVQRDVVAEMRRAASELARFEDVDAGFWREVLEGRACHAHRVWAETSDGVQLAPECFRDRQMARHLVWLARERYPDRKIIVWAATGHAMRTDTMSAAAGPGPSMGREASEALGQQSYTLSMTSYRGTFALPNGRPPQRIVTDQDPGFEFEELMAAAGFDHGFVDLRSPAARNSWLGGRFLARPDGHESRERPWTEVLDGLLFIRDQSRSRGLDLR